MAKRKKINEVRSILAVCAKVASQDANCSVNLHPRSFAEERAMLKACRDAGYLIKLKNYRHHSWNSIMVSIDDKYDRVVIHSA